MSTLVIKQGATFKRTWVYRDVTTKVPYDVTGWSARLQLRRTYDDPAPLVEFASATGDITITGAAGRFRLVIPADVTAAMGAYKKGVWDAQAIAPDGTVVPLAGGEFLIQPGACR